MDKDVTLVLPERIERSIFFIRSHKVMLDRDLASLYGVTTKILTRRSRDIKTDSPKISCFN
jgi:hypothetical protein